jgi:hypothetical protein
MSKEIKIIGNNIGIIGADTPEPIVPFDEEDKGSVGVNTSETTTIKQLPGIIRLKNDNGEIVNNISGNILDVVQDTSAGNILLMNKTHTKSYDGDYEFTLNRNGTISLTVKAFFDNTSNVDKFLEFTANDTYNEFRKSSRPLELVPNSNDQEIYYYSCLLEWLKGRPYLQYRFMPGYSRSAATGRRVEYEK